MRISSLRCNTVFQTLVLGSALLAICCAKQSQAQTRPNIIFLMADDQSTYSMGCYATPNVQTPNLDALARDGVVFDHHYDTTAICMASRASVMTGLLEYRTGCNFDRGALPKSLWRQSYPVLLREAGYQVAFAGKFGFLVSEQGGKEKTGELPAADFDRWGGGPGQTSYKTAENQSMLKYADEYPHSTLSYGAFGRDFVQDAARSTQPFCLSISFKAPHHPVEPDPQFDDIYRDAKFEKPANFGRENGQHFSLQSREGRQFERFNSWRYSSDYDGVMAKYYQQIYAIDVAVGMVRTAIESAGVADNTVIIYTSDNGFMCGSHGYGSKVLPYEEASRVPLIVCDPRHKISGTGQRIAALTGNVDFAPTILNLAGVAVPTDLDGRNLIELLDEPESTIHEYLPLINVWGPRAVHSLGIVTDKAKYIYWPYADEGFQADEEFYDLANDRQELHNLAHADRYGAMQTELRGLYRQALEHWRLKCVRKHGYPGFATIFDPAQDWPTKQAAYQTKN